MLCASCGTKVQLRKGVLVCKTCDSEFDFFDVEGELIPEPVYVPIRLSSQYAIIDTRKQVVYVLSDTNEKAELIANLLNKHLAQTVLEKRIHS
jgi:hypothetical protein